MPYVGGIQDFCWRNRIIKWRAWKGVPSLEAREDQLHASFMKSHDWSVLDGWKLHRGAEKLSKHEGDVCSVLGTFRGKAGKQHVSNYKKII